jgi:hypothetical protein
MKLRKQRDQYEGSIIKYDVSNMELPSWRILRQQKIHFPVKPKSIFYEHAAIKPDPDKV